MSTPPPLSQMRHGGLCSPCGAVAAGGTLSADRRAVNTPGRRPPGHRRASLFLPDTSPGASAVSWDPPAAVPRKRDIHAGREETVGVTPRRLISVTRPALVIS